MVNIGVLYRYNWQGSPRALHAQLLGDTVTINEADPVTCRHTELVGVLSWQNGAIVGDGLSDTRKAAISALINSVMQSV